MKQKQTLLIYACLAALILLWTAVSAERDCYYREFGQTSLQRFHQDTLSVDEYSEYSGPVAQTPAVSLPAGTYVVTMNYSTDTDSNTFYIEGENSGFPNQEGLLLAAPSSREITLELTEDAENLKVCLFYNDAGKLEVKNVVIASAAPVCTDRFAICAAALLLLAVLAFLDWKNSPYKKVYLWILALGILSSVPFFGGYLIEGQDMSFHLNRIEQICAGLKDGQLPVRIQPQTLHGYGYGAPMMYPELFLYIPALLRLLHVSMVTAVGIFVLLLNMATAGIMYGCSRRMLSSPLAPWACSLLYVFSIYRLTNLYTRFAIGELLAMTFMPLVVYGLFEVLKGNARRWPYLLAGICGVFQSHIISTVFAALIIGIFILIFLRDALKKERLLALVSAAVWAVILNLWFLVPFLYMFGQDLNTGGMQLQFEKMAVTIPQLLQVFPLSQGDTSFVGESIGGKMPLSIGISLVAFSGCYFWQLLAGRREGENSGQSRMPALYGCLGLLFALMASQWFPWHLFLNLPVIGDVIGFLQFPWRFLSCASLFLTFSAGAGACWLYEQYGNRLTVMLAAAILALLPAGYYMDDFGRGSIYFMKEELADRNDVAGGEYFYAGTDAAWLKEQDGLPVSDTEGFTVTVFEKEGTHIAMAYEWEETGSQAGEALIELPLLYYPGYQVRWQAAGSQEWQQLDTQRSQHQLLAVRVPREAGVIQAEYKGLDSFTWSLAASLAGLVALAAWLRHKPGHIAPGPFGQRHKGQQQLDGRKGNGNQ